MVTFSLRTALNHPLRSTPWLTRWPTRWPTRWWPRAGVAGSLLLAALPALAQYKVIGPDGRITYTDRPPAGAKTEAIGAGSVSGGDTAGSNLPYELKQVASRFPVTLYTSTDCAPCDQGRALLKQRGVPFTERTVSTSEDSAALRRLEGVDTVPLLRIGGQQIKGYAASDWNNYLTIAGYPAQSTLPPNYVAPPPTPLTPKPSASSKPSVAPPAPTPSPTPSNGTAPPGFQF